MLQPFYRVVNVIISLAALVLALTLAAQGEWAKSVLFLAVAIACAATFYLSRKYRPYSGGRKRSVGSGILMWRWLVESE